MPYYQWEDKFLFSSFINISYASIVRAHVQSRWIVVVLKHLFDRLGGRVFFDIVKPMIFELGTVPKEKGSPTYQIWFI